MTSIKCQKICFTTINTTKQMFPSYLELEKNCYQAILSLTNNVAAIWREKKVVPCDLNLIWKKLVPSYFEPDKHCCSYLERENSGLLLFEC